MAGLRADGLSRVPFPQAKTCSGRLTRVEAQAPRPLTVAGAAQVGSVPAERVFLIPVSLRRPNGRREHQRNFIVAQADHAVRAAVLSNEV
ncbi:hypothetical protein Mpe_B0471 (plasmid) [Methylibium petroleiphilum PM1]|uniref:Uncharacterized protein n=1 Tax=Methylibium petroleiphilum (strain ATCC BAA-1232 / LMG 22953 / PM1) TaxID=420662 RepID=A2SNS2_METPP|nr:hypothetical protein Mpe_B0436 [Methylibium petroleiphilum PM1]ABM97245.1 hypothetical protein Mpe_B0471 [Methylibium petroleiphilum PM1]